MEDDINEGPYTVWQMFNAPTLVLFNNLEHAADGLESDFSEVLVPRQGSTKYPDKHYCSFNTWLIGRLFYIWAVKELETIHILSKDAQLKLINILCANGATFHKQIHTQYTTILVKLIEYYKSHSNKDEMTELVLHNFVPEETLIPYAELNLEPIFVKVTDLETCKRLIDLLLQFLSQSIPLNSVNIDIYRKDYNELFSCILYMLEHFSLDLKLSSLRFFIDLIRNYNDIAMDRFHEVFPETLKDLLYNFEALIHSVDIFYTKGEISISHLKTINNIYEDLLNLPEALYEEYEEIIKNICVVIVTMKNTKLFSNKLILKSLSFSEKFEFPKYVMSIEAMDRVEIEMVKNCYIKNILLFMQNNKKKDNKLNYLENWYYKQVLSVIHSLKNCDERNIDMFVVSYHLQRSCKALDILQNVYITAKINEWPETNAIRKLLDEDISIFILDTLEKTIEVHNELFMKNMDLVTPIMDIALGTLILLRNNSQLIKSKDNSIKSLLCLTSGYKSTEMHMNNYSDDIKILILKYLLQSQLVYNCPQRKSWDSVISYLMQCLTKSKSTKICKEIITLCPLLLLNNHCTASKLIAEVIMPAFLTKDVELQNVITQVLPVIACMSLGHYRVVLNTAAETIGHTIFRNKVINICVICTNCHCEVKKKMPKDLVLRSANDNTVPRNVTTTSGLKTLFSKFANSKQYTDIDKTEYWNLISRL